MSRHDAPLLVKRLAPPIGCPHLPPRVTVAYQAYSQAEALKWATHQAESIAAARALYGVRVFLWIERRGRPATRRRLHA